MLCRLEVQEKAVVVLTAVVFFVGHHFESSYALFGQIRFQRLSLDLILEIFLSQINSFPQKIR